MHENLMKKLNLIKDNGLDKEASFKYIDEKVSDADWNKVQCHESTNSKII